MGLRQRYMERLTPNLLLLTLTLILLPQQAYYSSFILIFGHKGKWKYLTLVLNIRYVINMSFVCFNSKVLYFSINIDKRGFLWLSNL